MTHIEDISIVGETFVDTYGDKLEIAVDADDDEYYLILTGIENGKKVDLNFSKSTALAFKSWINENIT